MTGELKQLTDAKTAKLERYEAMNQYKINRMFVQNQKGVYQQVNGASNIKNEKQMLKRVNIFGVTYRVIRKNMKGKQSS